jgi:hypothetical protein
LPADAPVSGEGVAGQKISMEEQSKGKQDQETSEGKTNM